MSRVSEYEITNKTTSKHAELNAISLAITSECRVFFQSHLRPPKARRNMRRIRGLNGKLEMPFPPPQKLAKIQMAKKKTGISKLEQFTLSGPEHPSTFCGVQGETVA